MGGKIWEKSVISNITIYNMFLGAIGFIEYVKMILRRFQWVTYIPMSHSNTSSLESHFSLMRFLKADTAANYERTFNVADHEKSMEIMANNKMHEQNHEKIYTNITFDR